jgi:hypothetical protein
VEQKESIFIFASDEVDDFDVQLVHPGANALITSVPPRRSRQVKGQLRVSMRLFRITLVADNLRRSPVLRNLQKMNGKYTYAVNSFSCGVFTVVSSVCVVYKFCYHCSCLCNCTVQGRRVKVSIRAKPDETEPSGLSRRRCSGG